MSLSGNVEMRYEPGGHGIETGKYYMNHSMQIQKEKSNSRNFLMKFQYSGDLPGLWALIKNFALNYAYVSGWVANSIDSAKSFLCKQGRAKPVRDFGTGSWVTSL
jgi:hypothetical protein